MKRFFALNTRFFSFFNSKNGRLLLFIIGCLLYFLHHYFVFLGFYNNDDINYARYAAAMAAGKGSFISTGDHFALRWLPIAVTAFCYKFFGINDISTQVFSFTSLLLTGFVLFRFVKNKSFLLFIFSLILFFGNYSILFYTHRLLPDGGMCFLLFSAYFVYHRYKFGSSAQQVWMYAILFAALNFFAALTKETVIMVMPLYIFFIATDFKTACGRKFWIISILLLLLSLISYLYIFKIVTGDWFFRLHLLEKNSSLGIASYDRLPFVETLKRILYLLWQNFLINGDMVMLLPGLCAFFYRKKLGLSDSELHITTSFFILLLSADFMTISFNHYVPLLPDPRHFIFMFPLAAVSGSYMLKGFVQKPFQYINLVILYLVATITIFVINGGEMRYIYLLVTILLIVWLFFSQLRVRLYREILFLTAFISILTIRPFYDVYAKTNYFYFEQKEMILSTFPYAINKGIVYTGNDITAELCEYFLGFKTGNIGFINLKRAGSITANSAYLLLNTANSDYLNPLFTTEAQLFAAKGLKKISQHGSVILYKVENKRILQSLQRYAAY